MLTERGPPAVRRALRFRAQPGLVQSDELATRLGQMSACQAGGHFLDLASPGRHRGKQFMKARHLLRLPCGFR